MSPLRLLVLSAIATIAQLASAQSTVDTVRGLDSAWANSYATHDTVLARDSRRGHSDHRHR